LCVFFLIRIVVKLQKKKEFSTQRRSNFCRFGKQNIFLRLAPCTGK